MPVPDRLAIRGDLLDLVAAPVLTDAAPDGGADHRRIAIRRHDEPPPRALHLRHLAGCQHHSFSERRGVAAHEAATDDWSFIEPLRQQGLQLAG